MERLRQLWECYKNLSPVFESDSQETQKPDVIENTNTQNMHCASQNTDVHKIHENPSLFACSSRTFDVTTNSPALTDSIYTSYSYTEDCYKCINEVTIQ